MVTDPNKDAVLAEWPDAHLNTVVDIYKRTVFQIKATRFFVSGSFFSESEAWADAARRLK